MSNTVEDVLTHLEQYHTRGHAEFIAALEKDSFGYLGFNPTRLRAVAYLAALKTVRQRLLKLDAVELADSVRNEVLRRARFVPSSTSTVANHMEIEYTAALADIWAEITEAAR